MSRQLPPNVDLSRAHCLASRLTCLTSLAPITEDVSDEESGDIPFRDAPETNGTDEQDAAKDDEEEDEDESGDEAEGV